VWDVTYLGRPVARWGYRLSELDGGRSLLDESVEDRRERWLQIVSPWITGARDRAARNADTIGTTLHRIKALAEASAAASPVGERDEGDADLDGRTPPSRGVGG
jgi:hypothetical protein